MPTPHSIHIDDEYRNDPVYLQAVEIVRLDNEIKDIEADLAHPFSDSNKSKVIQEQQATLAASLTGQLRTLLDELR